MGLPYNPSAESGQSLSGSPLLNTKFHIPLPQFGYLTRIELIKRLQSAVGYRLCLLCAPAGYGKTNLAASAVRHRDRVAWLSLSAEDDNPLQFWRYFTASLRTALSNGCHQAEGFLRDAAPDQVQKIAAILLEDFIAFDKHTILVLDNFHVIQSSPIHEGIAFLLANLPPTIQFWITTRVEPPFNLARLRANGQLLELRQTDLEFSVEESAEFLQKHVKRRLPIEDIERLVERTEGWVAGLRLATLHLNNSAISVVEAVDGSHLNYLDYFEEEVLHDQPKQFRQFLLQTAVLDQIDGEIASVVTGMEDTAAILTTLDRENAFLVALDPQHNSFRYHSLFAETLRTLLRNEQPHLVSELCRRAADWYADHDHLSLAVEYAFKAREYDRAAWWIRKLAKQMLIEGELTLLRQWFDQMPERVLRNDLRLRVFEAWTRLLDGRWELLEQDLDGIAHELLVNGDNSDSVSSNPALLGEVYVVHARVVLLRLDFARVRIFIQQALQLLPLDSIFLRGIAELTLGSIAYLTGDMRTAQQIFTTETTGSEADGDLIQLLKLANLGYLYAQRGQLQLAKQTYDRATSFLHLWNRTSHFRIITGFISIGLGELELEWNHLEPAEYHLREGLRLSLPWRHMTAHMPGYFLLAKARTLLGDIASAKEAIYQLEDAVYAAPYRFPLTYLRSLVVQFELSQGNLEAGQRWLRTSGLNVHDTPQPMFSFEYFSLARVLLAQNQPEGIVALFTPLIMIAQFLGFTRSMIEMKLWQALSLSALGEHDAANAKFVEALRLAEPEDYRRIFLDKGESMKRLLMRLKTDSVSEDYVQALRKGFDQEVQTLSASRLSMLRPMLAEPLTERELDVLRLIALGYSNKQIAENLVITVGTVKTHVKGIFHKLDTENRTEAAVRARKIGLIDN